MAVRHDYNEFSNMVDVYVGVNGIYLYIPTVTKISYGGRS